MNTIGRNNISIRNVKSTLRDKANDLWSYCNSDNVNMWSKCKPVSFFGIPARITDDWCAGDKGDYSIKMGGRNNLDPSGRDLSVKKWVRDKPMDGVNTPARLADFGGYNHDAKPPIYIYNDTELKVNPYNYKFTIPLSTGDIDLSLLDLSVNTGWDRDYLRLMAVDTNTGVRYHCNTKLKDMLTTADYEFANQNTALQPAQNYNFRLFIAQYANNSIYSSTGDGTTIFNDNVHTLTDKTVKCKSMADIEAENITTTYSRYIKVRNLYYPTNTTEWHSIDLSVSVDNPASAKPYLDINNFNPYTQSLVFKLELDGPDNVLRGEWNSDSWRCTTSMLDYAQSTPMFSRYPLNGTVLRMYRDFNPLTGVLSNEYKFEDGYITRGSIIYISVPSRVYQSDLQPDKVKPVRSTTTLFFGKCETICSGTFYVKSDSQAQTMPVPSWNN